MNKHLKTLPRYRFLLDFKKIVSNPIPLIQDNMSKYGKTYITYFGGLTKAFITSDPVLIQHVLQKNNKNYHKPKLQTESIAKFVGYGLLTINGAHWLRQRRMIQPSFHKDKIKSLMKIMNKVALEYVETLKEKVKLGTDKMDMHQEMSILTLQMVSRSLFSETISEGQLQKLNKIISVIQVTIAKEIRQAPLKWWRKLTGEESRMHQLKEEAYDIIYSIIQGRRTSGNRFDDLLDMLLHSKYEDTGEGMTNVQIADEVMIIFAAGYETTANALSWSFYTLFQNPDCRATMLEQIEYVKEDYIGFEQVRQLAYLKQVMSETMRMYPPAWVTSRVALTDDEVNGTIIKEGELVTLFIYGSHHNTDCWESPSEFKPQRFSADQKSNIIPFSYLPFSGGPRLCIGVQFAEVEMQIVLYHLYKNFKFELLKDQEISMQPLVTLRPRYGIKMQVDLA